MGRAFEFRKARKLKRWGHMARVFTKLGKEISIAVKSGGPDPSSNPRLRALIATAKTENMPKDNIDRAIKKAMEKDSSDYKEIVYEGYGPAGIAILVETATDNNTRTVGNIRNYFDHNGGTLGNSGSLSFLFEHKTEIRAKKDGVDVEELELELIDFGAESVEKDDEAGEILIEGTFEGGTKIQGYLEENGFEILSCEYVYLPNDMKEVTPEQREKVQKLLDKIEDDEDVQNVYHNMVEDESEEA
ncbi:MAG: YebC/PmpR family DNA-binding transcriptional regulator [Paludibacteraceae bacterium]|nr:YebC/PmpR family DNA-binding transcriptional regulator [Paludibacteraceae bacterium]